MIGTTLGHYRIVDKIGEGGMGEVYRAQDERLDRDVAIKVLPDAVADDPQRLARFEREAKLLASLSHQNVATLHGLEEHEGQRFLVMELAEGETLAARIKKGPIPVDDALAIARQIAEGLEAAHESGIIHRDLKPTNVMISPEGKVKVLDFGLAKAFDPEGSGPQSPESLAESPTLTADLTRGVVLLGTAAYMSPEQARGKAVDKRTDIWAFGCVLYEMLTGSSPFRGTTSTEFLAAVIKEEPGWQALPAQVPAAVRRLLRRCLTKVPRDRVHDIADARIELQSLSIDDEFRDEVTASIPVRSDWRAWLPWGVAVFLAILVVAILVGPFRPRSPDVVTKVSVGLEPAKWLGSVGRDMRRGESGRLSRTAMALSPDGRNLVFSAGDEDGSRLYLRVLNESQATPIAGTEGAFGPFFSPDGQWVGFWADGSLKKTRMDGSAPTPVCDVPWPPYGASWGVDNSIVFGQLEGGILRVPATGGVPDEITALADGEFSHRHPWFLPNGETLLFTVTTALTGSWNEAKIVAQSMRTGERKTLVENGADPRYAPTGYLVFSRLGALTAAPFDPKRVEVTGGTVVVLDSVRQGVNAMHANFDTFSGQFTFSLSGTLIHVPGGVWPDSQNVLVWVDREGREEPLSAPPGPYGWARLSPDGTRVAVDSGGLEQTDIWVYEMDRGTLTLLTVDQSAEFFPLWTPDGARITFASDRSGKDGIYWIPADGSGTAEPLAESVEGWPASWSPSGQVLAFVQFIEIGNTDIWMLSPGDGPRAFIKTPFDERWPEFSPNGRWLAYVSNQSGRNEVYVTPYPGPGPRVQISTHGGVSPAWAPSGRELFFRSLGGDGGTVSMCAVQIATEPSMLAGKTKELFKDDAYQVTNPIRCYDVTPDGQKFLMLKKLPERSDPVTQLHVTLNWFEELKRLAPPK